jgi:hypothetical protein
MARFRAASSPRDGAAAGLLLRSQAIAHGSAAVAFFGQRGIDDERHHHREIEHQHLVLADEVDAKVWSSTA